MATIERTVEAVWEGSLAGGEGLVTFNSGATPALPVTWASRIEDPAGRTSPEELLAAALGACFSMALSNLLSEAGAEPERLHVAATCRAEKDTGGLRVKGINLVARGRVPGVTASAFADAVARAAEECPVGRALAEGIAVTHVPQLEG